jgi:hypothetical protein
MKKEKPYNIAVLDFQSGEVYIFKNIKTSDPEEWLYEHEHYHGDIQWMSSQKTIPVRTLTA